jgi:HTH-type transcriptional regulator / antitoxin HipB
MERFGATLRNARKAKGLSQAVLAASLGMSRATISGIENDTLAEIGIRKFSAVCSALGLELIVQARSQRPTLHSLREQRELRVRETRALGTRRVKAEPP